MQDMGDREQEETGDAERILPVIGHSQPSQDLGSDARREPHTREASEALIMSAAFSATATTTAHGWPDT